MSSSIPVPTPILVATSAGNAFPVRRVFCIGRNYAAHAREMGANPDREPPFFFTAWAETVVPGGGRIAYPQGTADYHHEIELVVAIGESGRNIPIEKALSIVHGYAVGLDMTRRDLQAEAKSAGRPWDVAKNVEQSKPVGKIRSGPDFDPTAGSIVLSVNGEEKQRGDLGDMIWSVAEVIAHISNFYRLEPGDLIFTGTPSGVGPVGVGDSLVCEIEGLETLAISIGPMEP